MDSDDHESVSFQNADSNDTADVADNASVQEAVPEPGQEDADSVSNPERQNVPSQPDSVPSPSSSDTIPSPIPDLAPSPPVPRPRPRRTYAIPHTWILKFMN